MLNLKHLYYYHIFAQELSTAKAAKRLSITSPTLSNQLKELEAFLGFRLTERVQGKAVVTEHGRMVAHYADKMFSAYEALRHRISVAPVHDMSHFRVGISQNLGARFSFDLLSLVVDSRLSRSVRSFVNFEPSDRIFAAMKNNELDLIIGAFESNSEVAGWSHQTIVFPVRLFGNKGLMTKVVPPVQDSKGTSVHEIVTGLNRNGVSVVIPAPSVLRDETNRFFAGLEVQPAKLIECNQSCAIVELIERGISQSVLYQRQAF